MCTAVEDLTSLATLFIGMSGSEACYAVALDDSVEPPQNYRFSDIRGFVRADK